MDNGHTDTNTPFFTAGAGVDSIEKEAIRNHDLAHSADANIDSSQNTSSNYDLRAVGSQAISSSGEMAEMGVSESRQPDPPLEKIPEKETPESVELVMPPSTNPERPEAISVSQISEQSSNPIEGSNSLTSSPAEGASEPLNLGEIKTSEMLNAAGMQAVEKLIEGLNAGKSPADFYDGVRDCNLDNISGSYGTTAAWQKETV